MKSILSNSINTKLFVLFLVLMFFDYSAYGYYWFYLSLAYFLMNNSFKTMDNKFFMLLAFGVFYSVIKFLNTGVFRYADVFAWIINMPFIYLFGKHLAAKNDRQKLVPIIFILTLSLASLSILSVMADIKANGFSIFSNVERNIPFIGITNTERFSATIISSKLLPLTSFFVFLLYKYNFLDRILYVFMGIIAIYCCLRLQSRTMIVADTVLLLMVVIISWKYRSKNQKIVLVLGLLVIMIATSYVLNTYNEQLQVLERFEDDNTMTAGRRTLLATKVAEHMFEYPMGGMPGSLYAHNLWLDVARVSGILPLFLLITISINFLCMLIRYVFNKKEDLILRSTFMIVSFSIFVVFVAEPVIEGLPMLFNLFVLIYGMLTVISRKNKYAGHLID